MQNQVLQTAANVSKELLQHPILGALSAIGLLIFQYGFGSSKVVLVTFVAFVLLIAMDWLSGTSAAKKDGIDTSRYGIDGVRRTVMLLALPGLARLFDILAGTEVIVMGFVVAVLARSVARSVIANIKRAGWNVDIPDKWLDWVADELAQKDARAMRRLEEKIKTSVDATKKDD